MKPRKILPWLVVLAFAAVAAHRLFRPGIFSMQDDMQVFRLWQFDKCLNDGQIPCRYVPDAGLGYGYPLFNFYPPLAYIVGECFHFIGFDFTNSIRLVFIFTFFLSSVSMFLLARQLFGSSGGLLASAFYTFAPYRAIDSFVRGSVSEFLALAIMPLVFYFFIAKKHSWFVLSLFCLIICHNLTAFVTLPLFLTFIFILYRPQFFKAIRLSLISLGLSAFFLIPAIFEKQYVTTETMTQGYFSFINHFATLHQLFISRFWGYGASLWGPVDDMSFQIGISHWFLPLITGILVFLKFPKHRPLALLLSLFSLFFIFLTHNRSTFIWQLLPFMAYFQFPWRFLGFAIFSLSLICALFARIFPQKILIPPIIAFVILLNIGYFREDIWYPISDGQKLAPANLFAQSNAGLRDYWPSFGTTYPTQYAPQIPGLSKKSNSATITIDNNTQSSITLSIVYFPGWQATINDAPIPINYHNDLGLIKLPLNRGQNNIQLSFHNTPLRTIANLISLVSLIIFVGYAYQASKK